MVTISEKNEQDSIFANVQQFDNIMDKERSKNMKLYHGSSQNGLTKIESKHYLFNGMFFSASRGAAESHGTGFIYSCEVDEDDIFDVSTIPWNEDAHNYIHTHWNMNGYDLDRFIDFVGEQLNVFDCDDDEIEELSQIINDLHIFPEIAVENYEVSFAFQGLGGEIARQLGYKAAAVHDEHGTSYLVLPGTVIHQETQG